MNDKFSRLLKECCVPADQVEEYTKIHKLVIPDEKLDVTKLTKLIIRECIWAFGETRTEPNLETYILDRFGIINERTN